jgi:dihydrofolate reductase
MARLIYTAIASLDGYVADEDGNFDWSEPDEAVHRFINDLERPAGTYLYGRRLYEVMAVWETMHAQPDLPPYVLDYAAIWRAAEKIVYSRTLQVAPTARTRIERVFDTEAIQRMKTTAATDLTIGGSELAAQALRAGLVDECRLFLTPVLVGGGKPALPGGIRVRLDLLDERRFGNGVIYLRYGVRA